MKFIGWSIVVCLLFIGFYQMMKYIHDKYEKYQAAFEIRQKNEESEMTEKGNREKVGLLTRIDILLVQSGIKKKFPSLVAELFITLDIVFGIGCFVCAWKLYPMFALDVVVLFGGIALPYILMEVSTSQKAAQIEEDIGVFLDMMDAYSKSSDDIVDIMGKVYPSLHEPLNEYLETFYFEALRTGDVDKAFMHLKYKIPHKKLKEILGELQMCSKQMTDYSNIIRDVKEQMRVYLDGKRERQDAKKNGAMELLIFFGVVGISIVMAGNITDITIVELFTGSIIGQCFLLYFGVLAIAGLFVTFSSDKG